MKVILISVLVMDFISLSVTYGKQAIHSMSSKQSSYDSLMKRLDRDYALIRAALKRQESNAVTVNEVDDFDYFMDQKSVKRAWSRNGVAKHQHHMNTHFVKLATENMKLVLQTAKCQIPTRRCLDVNKMSLGAKKSYWPNCAIVHKCGHDSGCCKYPGHVCSPTESENIELYFFSIEQSSETQTGRVERLTFENHTKCDCRPELKDSIPLNPPKICKCPAKFSSFSSFKSGCQCDCDKKTSRACKRIKRGKRSYPSNGCKGKCNPPVCDYGSFKSDFGRCPRKSERNRT